MDRTIIGVCRESGDEQKNEMKNTAKFFAVIVKNVGTLLKNSIKKLVNNKELGRIIIKFCYFGISIE